MQSQSRARVQSQAEAEVRARCPVWNATRADTDPADPHFFAGGDYMAAWRWARHNHPVAWTESPGFGGFWSVTTHREGAAVLKNTQAFGSTSGMRLGADPAGVAAAAGRMMVVADGDDHRRLRAAHAPWFNGRTLSGLLPDLTRRVDERVAELLEAGGEFDAVTGLSVKMPAWALFGMMGVPASDWDQLAALAAAAFDDADRDVSAAAARTQAHTEILGYFADQLDLRRAEPADDFVTGLAQAAPDGRPLTDDEVVLNCDGLVNGGLETTPHAASGALLAFHRHPEQWRALKARPELLDSAVEEILRWASPPMHAMRTATADVEVGPALVRRGDRVVVWIPSCNRDEQVFAQPDEFLVDRGPNPHLSFGGGPHYCVGSVLARLELRCLLGVLIHRVADIEVVGEPGRQPSNFLHGLARLDVRLTPQRIGSAAGSGAGPGGGG